MRKSCAWNAYASVHTPSAISAAVAYAPARAAGKQLRPPATGRSETANVYAALTRIAHSTMLPNRGSSIAGIRLTL